MSDTVSCAVIGTGAMGSALARALLAGGHPVTVWNRSRERSEPLVVQGAEVADSVAAAIAAADVILVCLAHTGITRELLETDGVDAALPGRTAVEFSVGRPADRVALEAWFGERDARYLAAAVKAYPREVGTSEATLNFFGAEQAFQDARPAFESLGQVRYLGPDIRAQEALQSASVILLNISVVALFEVAAYLAANDVPLSAFLERIPTVNRVAAAAASHAVALREEGGAVGGPAEATIEIWEAGLNPLVEAMRSSGVDPRLATGALAKLRDAIADGLGSRDIDGLLDLAASAATPAF